MRAAFNLIGETGFPALRIVKNARPRHSFHKPTELSQKSINVSLISFVHRAQSVCFFGDCNTDVSRRRPYVTTSMSQSRPNREDSDLAVLALSIEKSRKRHLSEGLLRGDLIHDKLKEQEAAASPLLKKTRSNTDDERGSYSPPSSPLNYFSPCAEASNATDKMAMTMADFKAYMDANTNKKLESVDEKLALIDGNVKKNSKRLDEQSASIQANQESIREMKGEMQKLKEGQFPALPGPARAVGTPDLWSAPSSDHCPAHETAFRLARRSLRVWPIIGDNADALWNAAGIFLGTNLGLKGRIDRKSIEKITRADIPSGPGVRDEALIVFVDSKARDLVMGSAAMLAPFSDNEGKPTAGMRIEVPTHLLRDFRLLFKYGQNLRARHGKGTRRHVKFDDITLGLYLNVKLPGDVSWSRVSTEVARRGLQARELIADNALETRLDIKGTPADRPRAASTSTSSILGRSTDGSTSAWTARRSESSAS